MDLVLVVALCEVYELEIERLLRQFGNLVLAFVLPYGGVYEVFVVTVGLAFGRLVLDTEVTAARLLAVQRVARQSVRPVRGNRPDAEPFSNSTLKSSALPTTFTSFQNSLRNA